MLKKTGNASGPTSACSLHRAGKPEKSTRWPFALRPVDTLLLVEGGPAPVVSGPGTSTIATLEVDISPQPCDTGNL